MKGDRKLNIIKRDLDYVWHPCSQMKDYEEFPPLLIKKAKGCFIKLHNGKKLIDAISSWWCKSLGHNHPDLQKAMSKQLKNYEHVISANICQKSLVLLSEKLCKLTKTLNKVFYASEGSTAIEIAIKMSLHARYIQNNRRNLIMSLKNAYHGETMMCMAISDIDLYRKPYEILLPKTIFLDNIPYVNSKADPLWQDCSTHWKEIVKKLNRYQHQLTAIIVEPIIQGAGGMRLYSQDLLKKLRQWTKEHQIHLIADEIMTGFGRTGKVLACHHANIEPDFICLSKGLTAGILPMSAVLTTTEIYNLFYDDYKNGKSFLHSNTFSGNALAAALALESIHILEAEGIYQKVQENESLFRSYMEEVALKTKKLTNIRGIGAIIAADLILDDNEISKRMAYRIYQKAILQGALLRPLGNTIYWLPPLNMDTKFLFKLKKITIKAIKNSFET